MGEGMEHDGLDDHLLFDRMYGCRNHDSGLVFGDYFYKLTATPDTLLPDQVWKGIVLRHHGYDPGELWPKGILALNEETQAALDEIERERDLPPEERG